MSRSYCTCWLAWATYSSATSQNRSKSGSDSAVGPTTCWLNSVVGACCVDNMLRSNRSAHLTLCFVDLGHCRRHCEQGHLAYKRSSRRRLCDSVTALLIALCRHQSCKQIPMRYALVSVPRAAHLAWCHRSIRLHACDASGYQKLTVYFHMGIPFLCSFQSIDSAPTLALNSTNYKLPRNRL
jgi:hypothetical protein